MTDLPLSCRRSSKYGVPRLTRSRQTAPLLDKRMTAPLETRASDRIAPLFGRASTVRWKWNLQARGARLVARGRRRPSRRAGLRDGVKSCHEIDAAASAVAGTIGPLRISGNEARILPRSWSPLSLVYGSRERRLSELSEFLFRYPRSVSRPIPHYLWYTLSAARTVSDAPCLSVRTVQHRALFSWKALRARLRPITRASFTSCQTPRCCRNPGRWPPGSHTLRASRVFRHR